jgi:hypothetical protein
MKSIRTHVPLLRKVRLNSILCSSTASRLVNQGTRRTPRGLAEQPLEPAGRSGAAGGRTGHDRGSRTIRWELAAARPDAFRPTLARSLNTLSLCLGRREDALPAIQEAVTIHRELATRWPCAYQ